MAETRTDIDKSKDCVAKALTAGSPGKLATFRTNPRFNGRPGHSTRAAFHFLARWLGHLRRG